jgi:hypothetical protein
MFGLSFAHKLRPRTPSEQISGGMTRIRQGLFGTGAAQFPGAEVTGQFEFEGLYNYHEGDLFSPGAGNWVFEPNFELPLVTIWGNAFLRKPNTFREYQPPQVWSNPTVVQNGIGGLQAGEYDLTGLSFEDLGPQELVAQ